MKLLSKRKTILIGIIILTLAVGSWYFLSQRRSNPTPDKADLVIKDPFR
ncbi:hypothetical protein [Alkaliphilus serpentinus]|nr:hypothetical protein [Alkaliphilus serpentinus]